MKAIIIDDERLAREGLKGLLTDFPFVEVCGEAANATAALKLAAEVRPDLLFLDIEMTGQNGFDLLEAMPPPHPHVIFVTAYSEFALRAFEVNALDYLLKPIDAKRLGAALEKVRAKHIDAAHGADVGGEEAAPDMPLQEDDRVFVRDGERCWFVPVRSIRLLESEGNHTRVYFDHEKPLIYRTLGSMEARLPARLFLRANRSQLVNLTFIETIGQWFSGSLKVALRGGPEVEFSRRQAQLFREHLSL
jgi:two-component system LytT family response regulator